MKQNDKRLFAGIILMVFSSICTCVGQLMWKEATLSDEKLLFYIIGFALYGIGAVIMMIAFRFGELSVLHPMLSVGFVLSIILGSVFLDEKISIVKVLGIGLIIIGMVFLGRSAKGDVER